MQGCRVEGVKACRVEGLQGCRVGGLQVSIWLLGVGAVLLFFIPCCLEICLCRSVWKASFFGAACLFLLACVWWFRVFVWRFVGAPLPGRKCDIFHRFYSERRFCIK